MGVVRVTSLFLLLLIIQCNGVLRFANYIQDHMVLQRAPQRAVVWGFGDPKQLTTLRMNDKVYKTMSRSEKANEVGESIWSVTLDPVTQDGPFDVHVSQPLPNGTNVTIILHDVLFGDVWICSGQSNMQMTVGMIFNATEEIAQAANFPKIRVFTAALKPADQPVEELLGILENWSVPSAQTIGGPEWSYMSAVCWLYGREIHQALGGRPIGLIATTWGGTAIELWMPPPALHDCGITTKENVAIQQDHEHLTALSLSNSNLYNAMIYPFTRMVVYGSIWYQGEANADYNRDKYACTFAKMIQSWRQVWNERTNGITDKQFPFGFVQLSTWTGDSTKVGGFPWIRWHQTLDVGTAPNEKDAKLFMAVSCDLRDDPNGIHPRTKHDVGYRLSRAGLAVAYDQQVEFRGPTVKDVAYQSGGATVKLTYQYATGIDFRSPDGFDVCCQGSKCSDDSAWIVANNAAKSGDLEVTVPVPTACVNQAVYGIRYLWRETPCPFKKAAIYSSTDSNLPSPPYLKVF